MLSKKVGKHEISILKGRITTDSYEETIKKLSIVPQKQFTQLAPLRVVAGENHILFALEHTFSAFENKTAFAKKPELEFIIRLLAEKQLNKALEKAKFKKGENLLLVVGSQNKKVIGETKTTLGFEEKEFSLGENKKGLMELFKVSEGEIKALGDLQNPLEELIIERVSFVALER